MEFLESLVGEGVARTRLQRALIGAMLGPGGAGVDGSHAGVLLNYYF